MHIYVVVAEGKSYPESYENSNQAVCAYRNLEDAREAVKRIESKESSFEQEGWGYNYLWTIESYDIESIKLM